MGFADVLKTEVKKTGFGSVLGDSGFDAGFAPKPDVSTIKGLEQVAKKEGLGERVTEIMAEKGAFVTKKIYKGRPHTILPEEINLAKEILANASKS